MFKNSFTVFFIMFTLIFSVVAISQEYNEEFNTTSTPQSDIPKLSLFAKAGISYITLDNEFINYVLPDDDSRLTATLSIEPEYLISNNMTLSFDVSFSFMSNKDIIVNNNYSAEDGYMSLTALLYINYYLHNYLDSFVLSFGGGFAKSRYTYDGYFYTTNNELIDGVSDWSCNTMFGWSLKISYIHDTIKGSVSYSSFYSDLQDDSYLGFNHSLTVSYLTLSIGINVL